MIENKVCSKCSSALPLSAFSCDRKSKDGISNRCRACASANHSKWYAENRQRVICKSKARHAKHRADQLTYLADYYQRTKEKARANGKEWASRNREKHLAMHRQIAKRCAERLTDSYVARQLRLPVADAKPIIPLKREQLHLLRLARQLKKAADESRTEHP